MIILYGSYARNTYVDCDRRRDYGVTTFFMSDYDILIVTRRRLGLKESVKRIMPNTVYSFDSMRVTPTVIRRDYWPGRR